MLDNPEYSPTPRRRQADVDPQDLLRAQERRLIKAAKGGDRAAFDTLFAPYRGKLKGFCRRLAGDDGLADDAVQDAANEAWTHISALKDPAHFSAWVHTIARRRTFKLMRRRRPEPAGVEAETVPDLSVDPLDALIARERLESGLATLVPERRRPLMLSLNGLSYDEISLLEGVCVNTIRSRIGRGRAELRGYLSEH